MIWINILVLVILIALNAFFVSVEFAAVSSRRARLDLMADADSHTANIVRTWLDSPATRDRLIAATQLGITIVSLALGAIGENTFEEILTPLFISGQLPPALAFLDAILPALPLLLSLIIVTAFHVVLGEQVPKVAVLRSPEKFAMRAAPIMQVFGTVFHAFISLLDGATRLTLRMFGLPADSSHSSMFTLEEIKQMVSGPDVEGVIEEPEREMLSAVIDFGELVVRQVAIPRTEIIAVEADLPLSEAVRLATENSITKLPVYDDDMDNILGILHIRDILQAVVNGKADHLVTRDLVREALYVPETISVNVLMREFRSHRTHMAIVLDEYGGTSGVVTLEDLMEEIIGEVQDPFDQAPPSIQPQPDGSALIDGLALIEEINEHFNLELEDANYDTIAGYVLGKLGRIPQAGDAVDDTDHGIRLKVEEMDRLRIATVRISHLSETLPIEAESRTGE